MVQGYENAVASAAQAQQRMMDMVGRLLEAARPEAVFGAPITAGGQTLITTSEVAVGFGTGFGTGIGNNPQAAGATREEGTGAGGGGGGGGFGGARPVAVISAGPEGIHIEPIFDVTKIALALFTTVGTMLIMRARMRRGR